MKIKWIGEVRIIPNHGRATKGSILDLPDNKAESFIKQGLATTVKPKIAKVTGEPENG